MTWEDEKGIDAETPRVSVIIATRNRPRDIMCAVQSVALGIEQLFEIVVVDQSDDDSTWVALHEAYREDARIRYVRDAARGAARARNLGLRAARADLMAIIDV